VLLLAPTSVPLLLPPAVAEAPACSDGLLSVPCDARQVFDVPDEEAVKISRLLRFLDVHRREHDVEVQGVDAGRALRLCGPPEGKAWAGRPRLDLE
jgi:hypothetical protein